MYNPDSLQALQQPMLAQVLLLADEYSAPVVADNAVRVLAAKAASNSSCSSSTGGLDPAVARKLLVS